MFHILSYYQENDYKFKIETLEQQLLESTKKFENEKYENRLEIV